MIVSQILKATLSHGCHFQNHMQKGEPMSKLIEIVLVALACPLALPFVIKKEGEADDAVGS